MKIKTAVTIALLLFVGASIVTLVVKETRQAPPPTSPPAVVRGVTVTYFYGNVRCATCRTLEAYSKKAIEDGFPEALRDGRLTWQTINVDEPGNEHFVKDYELTSKALVVNDVRSGSWKNLKRIWDLVGDESAYLKYVRDEVRGVLEP